jgi:VanZ family protein
LLVCYWIALFVATHVPMPGSMHHVPHGDKLAHFAAYAGLAFLFAFALQGKNVSLVGYACVLGVVAAYGLVDEGIQWLIPSRSASIKDWIADVAGGVAGISAHFATALVWCNLFAAGSKPAEHPGGDSSTE